MKGTNSALFASKEGEVGKVSLEEYLPVGNPHFHEISMAVVGWSRKQLEEPAIWLLDRAEVAIDMMVVGRQEVTLAAANTSVFAEVVSRHGHHCVGEE